MSYGKGPASSGPNMGASPQEQAECGCETPRMCEAFGCVGPVPDLARLVENTSRSLELDRRVAAARGALDRAGVVHRYASGGRNREGSPSALRDALANEAATAAEVAELRAEVANHKRWRLRRAVIDGVMLVLIVIWGVLG